MEQNVVNSIDGATALKLDEGYEIKNSEEQNAVIDSFENNEESQIVENSLNQNNIADEIPTGVSIESASYIENNSELGDNEVNFQNINSLDENLKEEHTPKLFSDEQNSEENELNDTREDVQANQLFDQDTNEEEDFEIPAFLRRQKF